MIKENKNKNNVKNFFLFLVKAFLFIVFISSLFLIGKMFTDIYINFDNFKNKDLIVLKKTKEKIIIPYIYTYVSNDKFISYKKESTGISIENQIKTKVEKSYTEEFEKKDKLYDTFYIKKLGQNFDVNLRNMGKYNFVEKLESFSSAPYYDEKNKTLYIFSHSSGKMFNPGKEFYKLEVGDKIDFIDYDGNIVDTYIVDLKKIYLKDNFFNDRFLNIKDKILLVTCYPLNSTSKRMVIELSKI